MARGAYLLVGVTGSPENYKVADTMMGNTFGDGRAEKGIQCRLGRTKAKGEKRTARSRAGSGHGQEVARPNVSVFMCVGIIWESCYAEEAASGGLGWSLRFWVSKALRSLTPGKDGKEPPGPAATPCYPLPLIHFSIKPQ